MFFQYMIKLQYFFAKVQKLVQTSDNLLHLFGGQKITFQFIKTGSDMEFQLTCAITFYNYHLLNWQFCGAHQLKEKTFGLSSGLISHAAFPNVPQ